MEHVIAPQKAQFKETGGLSRRMANVLVPLGPTDPLTHNDSLFWLKNVSLDLLFRQPTTRSNLEVEIIVRYIDPNTLKRPIRGYPCVWG
jgi:hypothetical protein